MSLFGGLFNSSSSSAANSYDNKKLNDLSGAGDIQNFAADGATLNVTSDNAFAIVNSMAEQVLGSAEKLLTLADGSISKSMETANQAFNFVTEQNADSEDKATALVKGLVPWLFAVGGLWAAVKIWGK